MEVFVRKKFERNMRKINSIKVNENWSENTGHILVESIFENDIWKPDTMSLSVAHFNPPL